MALNNDDLFLVNQGGVSKKLTYENLKSNLVSDAGQWNREGTVLSPAVENGSVEMTVDDDNKPGLEIKKGDELRFGMYGNGSMSWGESATDRGILGREGEVIAQKFVVSGDDSAFAGAQQGAKLFDSGVLHLYRDFKNTGGTQSDWTVFGYWDDIETPGASLGADNAKILFKADGSATFKGDVVYPGKILNIQDFYDAGGLTTSATFVKSNADYIRYNPKSDNSKIYWWVDCFSQTNNLNGYNTYGSGRVNHSGNYSISKPFGSPSSTGGVGWQGTMAWNGSFVNSGTNQKLFSIEILSQVGGATSTVTAQNQNWIIMEVQL